MIKPLTISGIFTCLGALSALAVEREIYFTDFEDAPVGDGQLIGWDSWVGSNVGGGWHGIDEEAVQGLGQSAFIGFNSPQPLLTERVVAGRPISHDPVATGERFVRLTAVVGISDTQAGAARNLFFIDFANSSFERLASLNYNNTENAFGLWRDDGIGVPEDTGEEFIRDEVQLLFVEIDLIDNTWSVELDGFPIFRDQTFTEKPDTRDLGAIFFTWQRGISLWGDNWMLIDDLSVSVDSAATVVPDEPFELTSVSRDESDCVKITWNAQPGFDYQVEYSDDGVTWLADLPDSLKSEPVEVETTFTDTSSASVTDRIYRVVRTQSGS